MVLSIFLTGILTLICIILAFRHYLYSRTYGSFLDVPLSKHGFLVLSGEVLTALIFLYIFLFSIVVNSFGNEYPEFSLPLIIPVVLVLVLFIHNHVSLVRFLQEMLMESYLNDCYSSVLRNKPIQKRKWVGKTVPYLSISFLNGRYDLTSLESDFDCFEECVNASFMGKELEFDSSDLAYICHLGSFAYAIALTSYSQNYINKLEKVLYCDSEEKNV